MEGRKEKKSFETDLTMPNNLPETAQKNNLSSWKSLYTQLIFLNTIYLQTHTHSGIFEEKKSILFIKSHPGNNLLGFLAIIQSSRHIQLCVIRDMEWCNKTWI